MNSIIKSKEKNNIEEMIYEVRGKQVMLDSDLARLYECANGTKTINLAVKRHINRFPERFMFKITLDEYNNLRFQSETSRSNNTYGGRRYEPYVFTEQGVAMLATVLKTPIAEEVSIRIMDAFVAMKKYISSSLLEQKYINELVIKNSNRIDLIENALSKFQEKNNHLFFKGQIYDAYSLLMDILNKSKKEIIIIDNYIDKGLLDILRNINHNVKIITNKYNNKDYEKYQKEYSNISLVINNDFHDRFIIIDNKELYHCGASFKDLGKKCFEITKIEESDILILLLKKISEF